ncbi:MAG: Hsp20/alpha crystallin family protein [Candidatus Paceibacterota bacterium]
MFKKRSFFEKLTGGLSLRDYDEDVFDEEDDFESEDDFEPQKESKKISVTNEKEWIEEEEQIGELSVDVYQTNSDIVVQAMVAGVRPEDLNVDITRDTVTISGSRKESKTVKDDEYFTQELYWGSFSRTIALPEEVDPDEAEATEKHGLLVLKLPKIDKNRQTKLKIKSI